jgi:hypothetical protein
MASTGQILAREQVPHSAHSFASMEEASFVKLIASMGHKGKHEPQPMHNDESMMR